MNILYIPIIQFVVTMIFALYGFYCCYKFSCSVDNDIERWLEWKKEMIQLKSEIASLSMEISDIKYDRKYNITSIEANVNRLNNKLETMAKIIEDQEVIIDRFFKAKSQ
jgi:hypothetical protein